MAKIGVLALQGGYTAHARALEDIGHEPILVRNPAELDAIDGLILPGGESSTHLLLIEQFGLQTPLNQFATSGKPVFATCAGLILSARNVKNPPQASFGWLDIAVSRNAWGRQVHSFEAQADDTDIPLMFIRAPRIEHVGPDVEVLLRYQGEPVLLRQGNVYGATFHPELTRDRRLHAQIFGTFSK